MYSPESWNMDVERLVPGFPMTYLKAMSIAMLQLSGLSDTYSSKLGWRSKA